MRTNIVIDEQLIAAAQRATGIQTKRAVVEEGLRMLVRLHGQSAVKAWRPLLCSDTTLIRWSTIGA